MLSLPALHDCIDDVNFVSITNPLLSKSSRPLRGKLSSEMLASRLRICRGQTHLVHLRTHASMPWHDADPNIKFCRTMVRKSFTVLGCMGLRIRAALRCSSPKHGRALRFGTTAKVLAKCKLNYYRISEYGGPYSGVDQLQGSALGGKGRDAGAMGGTHLWGRSEGLSPPAELAGLLRSPWPQQQCACWLCSATPCRWPATCSPPQSPPGPPTQAPLLAATSVAAAPAELLPASQDPSHLVRPAGDLGQAHATLCPP